jgi:hypothetical protein
MTRDELALAIGDWIILGLVAASALWIVWGLIAAFL